MSETPQQAEAVGWSGQIKSPRYLQIGIALLAAAAVCLLVLLELLPDLRYLRIGIALLVWLAVWLLILLELLHLRIEITLLVVAAIAVLTLGLLLIVPGPVDFPPEFFRYVSEIIGFYSLVFLIIGVLGPPGSPRDYFGGAALIALALFAFEASRDLPGMRGFAFGPGTAPRMFSFALGALGVAVSATGLLTKGPGIDRFHIRGPLFVFLSVVLFAWLVRPLGLVIASFLSICAAAGATPEARVHETLICAAVLTLFCCLLFPYALNLPMQLWPNNWDLASILKGLSTIR
jgi:putative tricarboxylic transport membrane protein